jgi:uncharacterized protein YegP (UPF0339 family)
MPSTPEFYQDDSGQWRWRAVAPNGRIVADSGESYHNRKDCEAGYLSAVTPEPLPESHPQPLPETHPDPTPSAR